MKKAMRISMLFVLCGLVMLTMPKGAGSVHASSQASPTIQVQDFGYTSSVETTTVSATCPQNYHMQSGKAEINASPSAQGQMPMYAIQFNGPNAQRTAWTTTVANKVAANLNITVTATCVAT
jgi:hypothetical protein